MNIKKFRNARNLTQTQLSERSGVALSIINRLENGKRRSASWPTVCRLAYALNIEPQELAPVRIRHPRRQARYCEMCDRWWSARARDCPACGAPTRRQEAPAAAPPLEPQVEQP